MAGEPEELEVEEVVEEIVDDEPADEMREALDAAIEEHGLEGVDELYEEGKKEDEPEPKPDDEPAPKDIADDDPKPDDEPPTEIKEKPPIGWSEDTKKKWGDVPEEVRTAVADREREVAITMQQTAEARRVAKDFSETMMQYKEPLQALGFNDPFQALNTVLGSAARMSKGTTEERAQAAAEVIRDFGIDISALDDALVTAGTGSPTGHIDRLLNERLAPVNELMSEIQQARLNTQQSAQQNSAQEVSSFMADKEFASDVRMDMADLLDLAASRNQPMTLQAAYDKACMMNPSVSEKLMQRKEQERQAEAKKQLEQKKQAASSVSGTPAGGGEIKSAGTMEDALRDAWDLHLGG